MTIFIQGFFSIIGVLASKIIIRLQKLIRNINFAWNKL